MITNKQRAFLSSMANGIDPVFQCGKNSITPEFIQGIDAVLEKRELIKISVLKNCLDDPHEIAQIVAERTHSDVVRVIGKKIILYRPSKKTSDRTTQKVNHPLRG